MENKLRSLSVHKIAIGSKNDVLIYVNEFESKKVLKFPVDLKKRGY